MFHSIYQSIKAGFNQSRLSFLFRRTALAQLITQSHPPSPWNFFNTYFASWWWNRLWFRSQIGNSAAFDAITQSMRTLKNAGIYNELNCNAVATHAAPSYLAGALLQLQRAGISTNEALSWLEQAGLSNDATLLFVTRDYNHFHIENVLQALREHNILDINNFVVVAARSNYYPITRALSYLQQAGILTQENREWVAARADFDFLADALFQLHLAGFLNDKTLRSLTKINYFRTESALQALRVYSILDVNNFVVVVAHADPYRLARALFRLQRADILTPENRDVVAAHANPFDLARALSSLQRAGILTEENRDIVAAHDDPFRLTDAFSTLQQTDILTQANFALVAAHADLGSLARALSYLQVAGILTEENRDVVAAHANPFDLARALSSLQRAGILTEENRDIVAAHADPYSLAAALSRLQGAGILTKENLDKVADHANPEDLARALSSLQRAGILTPENRDVVAARANPVDLANAFFSLQRAGILNQENFGALLAPNHAVLVSDQARQRIWDRMPRQLITQVNFQRLLTAAEHANPMAELQRVVDLILGIQARAGHAAAFNPAQSTHTASVHRSVSASATKLLGSYGQTLDLEAKIEEIKVYVDGLPDSPKNQAAKRCIERITTTDYAFTDSSGVSTRQLLALAYAAIHHKEKCSATLDDAKALFIQGLYEIQRGYNLSDSGQDQGGADRPICTAGTFNKLMEKLNGIHSDVELYYITRAGASSKFPKLAQEHALAYLKAHPDDLARIKEAGSLEPIWENIKAEVAEALWDEFKDAYNGDRSNRDFLALLDNGQYVQAPDLSEIEAELPTPYSGPGGP